MKRKGMLLYTGSNSMLAAATFLGSFVCARLLEPKELGAFQTAQLLVTYLAFLPLGTFNGFNRQYPYLLGKGDSDAAIGLSQTGYTVSCITAIVAAALSVGQLFLFWETGQDSALILAAAAVIPVAVIGQLAAVQFAILTGRQAFGWIGRTQLVMVILTLASLLFVWKFAVVGQCVRLVIIAVATWLLYHLKTGEARHWRWDFDQIRQLVRIGAPIMVIGYTASIFSVADRTLVASVKGIQAVGYYSLAGLTIAAIQSVYTPLAVAMYSKANHAYGQSHRLAALVPPLNRFLILITATVVPLAAIIYFSLPVVVPWLLPKYVPGIAAARIACIASVVFCYCGTAFVFNVTGHNRIYGIMMACALGAFFLIGFCIPQSELTLERVAWLRAVISMVVCLLANSYLVFYLRRGIRTEGRSSRK